MKLSLRPQKQLKLRLLKKKKKKLVEKKKMLNLKKFKRMTNPRLKKYPKGSGNNQTTTQNFRHTNHTFYKSLLKLKHYYANLNKYFFLQSL